jgi:iron complex outermembrane receptor protein
VGGLTVQNLGPGQSQVALRGVSAGQIVRDQPGVKEQVGIYLDESVISLSLFTPDLDLFDTNRVEVLAAPRARSLDPARSRDGALYHQSTRARCDAGLRRARASAVRAAATPARISSLASTCPIGRTTRRGSRGITIAWPVHRRGAAGRQRQEERQRRLPHGLPWRGQVRSARRVSIVPRIVYQRVKMNGWNRTDSYNILANPFTTTRPPVTLNGREQFTQLEETFRDDFVLGDLNLTSDRRCLTHVGDDPSRIVTSTSSATPPALTASITGGSIGLPQNVYTLDAPLDDATKANVFTQEVRFSSARGRVPWVAAASTATAIATTARTCSWPASRI